MATQKKEEQSQATETQTEQGPAKTDQKPPRPGGTANLNVEDGLPAPSFARETLNEMKEFTLTEQDQILTDLITGIAAERNMSYRTLLNRL